MFFDNTPVSELTLFFIIYGGAAMAALIASLYLCLRRGNAFAPDITPPTSLRRWAASFFASAFLSHVWWFLFYTFSGDINSVFCAVVSVIDYLCLLTSIAGTLFAMLQDRRRRAWPVALTILPFAVFLSLNAASHDWLFLNIAIGYLLVVLMLFSFYVFFAVRQYGRWLRDNYADLEHKEVWLSHVLVLAILLLFIGDGFAGFNIVIGCLVQIVGFVLSGILLWRVETLPQLENAPTVEETLPQLEDIAVEQACSTSAQEASQEAGLPTHERQPLVIPSKIEELLEEHCVQTQLYLQHDLTLQQLAHAVGTNRTYLGLYFSRRDITYNAYINDLRIDHFMRLYREAAATKQSITAQQLASDSGYRSYSTFSLAFKQRTGQSVTAWMREMAGKDN